MAEGAVHAQTRQTNRPNERRENFQKRKLETVVLKIKGSGREFTGLVPENAGVNERIERIVKQNGGEIKKRYNEELNAWEITRIKIGDQLLAKNDDVGIHWGIDGGKIPLAVDKNKRIRGFLNGEEVKSKEISVWSESSTDDPRSIEELRGNRRRVVGAHATSREKDPELKNSEIILFDKETGELTPYAEHTKVESFDWDIKVEKLLMPQALPVEKYYSHKMFDGFSPEMQGNFYYTYIEIMDSKESLTDRVTVIPLASQKFDGHPMSNAEPAIQEYPKPCAGETFFHDHKTDIRLHSETQPVEFGGNNSPARKVVFKETPHNYVITKRKSAERVKTKQFKIKSGPQEKRGVAHCQRRSETDMPRLIKIPEIRHATIETIFAEERLVKNTEYREKNNQPKDEKGVVKSRKKKRNKTTKMKTGKILKNKMQKKKKKAENKISVPEIRKKERMKKTRLQPKNDIPRRKRRKHTKKLKEESGAIKKKTKKKKKAKTPGPKDEIKRGFKKPVKKTEKARRLRKLLERKKKIEKYLLTGYF